MCNWISLFKPSALLHDKYVFKCRYFVICQSFSTCSTDSHTSWADFWRQTCYKNHFRADIRSTNRTEENTSWLHTGDCWLVTPDCWLVTKIDGHGPSAISDCIIKSKISFAYFPCLVLPFSFQHSAIQQNLAPSQIKWGCFFSSLSHYCSSAFSFLILFIPFTHWNVKKGGL